MFEPTCSNLTSVIMCINDVPIDDKCFILLLMGILLTLLVFAISVFGKQPSNSDKRLDDE